MDENKNARIVELERVNKLLLESLKWLLPLAEGYLRNAPSHPDNAKLESARAAIARAEGR